MFQNNIGFRDRQLNSYEHSYYYCKKCRKDVHVDMIDNHKCNKSDDDHVLDPYLCFLIIR